MYVKYIILHRHTDIKFKFQICGISKYAVCRQIVFSLHAVDRKPSLFLIVYTRVLFELNNSNNSRRCGSIRLENDERISILRNEQIVVSCCNYVSTFARRIFALLTTHAITTFRLARTLPDSRAQSGFARLFVQLLKKTYPNDK